MKSGDCYAVEKGKYLGKFIVYIGKKGLLNQFLMMPGDFKILEISNKEIDSAINSLSFINFVETLPNDVYDVIAKQFLETKKQKNNIIRDLLSNRK